MKGDNSRVCQRTEGTGHLQSSIYHAKRKHDWCKEEEQVLHKFRLLQVYLFCIPKHYFIDSTQSMEHFQYGA